MAKVMIGSVEKGTVSVEVEAGQTVEIAARKAGLDLTNYTIEVNGNSASVDTAVDDGDFISTTKNYDGGTV